MSTTWRGVTSNLTELYLGYLTTVLWFLYYTGLFSVEAILNKFIGMLKAEFTQMTTNRNNIYFIIYNFLPPPQISGNKSVRNKYLQTWTNKTRTKMFCCHLWLNVVNVQLCSYGTVIVVTATTIKCNRNNSGLEEKAYNEFKASILQIWWPINTIKAVNTSFAFKFCSSVKSETSDYDDSDSDVFSIYIKHD